MAEILLRTGVLASCLWGIILAACTAGTTPVPTAEPTIAIATVQPSRTATAGPHLVPAEWLKIRGGLHELDVALSPDSRWLACHTDDGRSVKIVSVADPALVVQALPGDAGQYLEIAGWAPDSSAFVVLGSEVVCHSCPIDHVAIYRVKAEASNLDFSIFEPGYTSGERDFATSWVPLAWSPDASQLAISVNLREVLILDKQARLIRRFTPELGDESRVVNLWWSQAGLFYVVEDEATGYQLGVIDPRQAAPPGTILTSQDSLLLLGAGSSPDHVLVLSHHLENGAQALLVINGKTGAVERSVPVEGNIYNSSDSPRSPFTAFTSFQDGVTNLWIFDWVHATLASYGRIEALLGWHTDVQGFLVVRKGPSGELWLETITP
jgi:hypothetical protein